MRLSCPGRSVASLVALFAAALPAQREPWPAGPAPSTDTVVHDATQNAFGFALPSLTSTDRRAFVVGNSFFKQNWVQAPASTADRDGLGPLFNARSCSACHLRDGRSAPPGAADIDRHGLLLRIGVRAEAGGSDLPHPRYGTQIQDVATSGVRAEARVVLATTPVAGAYGDGTPFELAAPRYELHDLGYGPIGDATIGPRVAPHLIGLGLLEAIADDDLLAVADADDRDGDGISGRVHRLAGPGSASPAGDATGRIGRFGWKATQATVRAQVAAAFANDMGITSPEIRDEPLAEEQRTALAGAADTEVEIDAPTLARVVFYTQALAVPAARQPHGDEAAVVAGRASFALFGCAACHVPVWTTSPAAAHPSFRSRTIAPFTDLLLHDLGPGLADGKHDGDAAPAEWRTAPLWGLGLVPTVNGHSRYLHDGRARGLAEAILWHGGEAEAAKERFRTAAAAERAALLAFLQTL